MKTLDETEQLLLKKADALKDRTPKHLLKIPKILSAHRVEALRGHFQRGVDPNEIMYGQVTVFSLLCWKLCITEPRRGCAMIQTALDFGADLHRLDTEGTPLYFDFPRYNRLEEFTLCLKHGANVHVRAKDGRSILSHSIPGCDIETVSYLLLLGCDYTTEDLHCAKTRAGGYDFYQKTLAYAHTIAARFALLHLLTILPVDVVRLLKVMLFT